MDRKGFKLIELLVVLVILFIIGSLIFGGIGGCSYYSNKGSGVFQCVKTYTFTKGGDSPSTSKRVDLRGQNGVIETMTVDDNIIIGQYNSATVYAQFEPGKWYSVQYVGNRREGYGAFSWFPNITSVSQVPDPNK